MNRLVLDDLQRRRAYPSVTVLLNTEPGPVLTDADRATIVRLLATVDRRLDGDVTDAVRGQVLAALDELVAQVADEPTSVAVALCASPEHTAVVRLGREVEERVVVDETFATRDLVADLNRTARLRVVTISDRRARLLVGDRHRLVEVASDDWPLVRDDDAGPTLWVRSVASAIVDEQRRDPLPTVLAGVQRSVRSVLDAGPVEVIGSIPGNHDRTGRAELHRSAWPIVTDWLDGDRDEALARLERARSARRFAGGIDEVWPLATEGRVELLVVDETYSLAVRIDDHGALEPADDPEAPDVVDDIVDEAIEQVLLHGGKVVMVGEHALADHGSVAAALRY